MQNMLLEAGALEKDPKLKTVDAFLLIFRGIVHMRYFSTLKHYRSDKSCQSHF
jgi:hypothetical protein